MSLMKPALAAAAALMLSGCVTQTNYDASREALRGSPGLRTQFVNNCVTNIRAKPLNQRQAMATVMNTSVRNAPRTYCQRITNGITSGRLTRGDINSGARGQLTPAVVRVLQGR
ncbi:hypothetical protein FY036_17130 [Mesorhizobium microcysteis]|uniref:Lipoprotein n=1 Tax=Neoaquamicrobium microcysteis TaxID=2682781 RepID=A0A5D4GQW7_9HYPH|nr:hypothetical protein [Mesorhizobium microcysteis]TYR30442.1 hypothetical protein FY036_17130 [Mesorhizobium microcysteis]